MHEVLLEVLGPWLLVPVVVTMVAVFHRWKYVVNVVLLHRDRWLMALAVQVVTNFLVAAAVELRGVAFNDGVVVRAVRALNGKDTATIFSGLCNVRVAVRARR